MRGLSKTVGHLDIRCGQEQAIGKNRPNGIQSVGGKIQRTQNEVNMRASWNQFG
jgi:hypothetical protein